jgi:hypothetical protein
MTRSQTMMTALLTSARALLAIPDGWTPTPTDGALNAAGEKVLVTDPSVARRSIWAALVAGAWAQGFTGRDAVLEAMEGRSLLRENLVARGLAPSTDLYPLEGFERTEGRTQAEILALFDQTIEANK